LGTAPGGGEIVADDVSGSHGGRSPGYYQIFINVSGSLPGTWFVWIVGADGLPASDPAAGRFETNAIRDRDAPGVCWRQVVDFVKQR
jgi:hypothetical protein